MTQLSGEENRVRLVTCALHHLPWTARDEKQWTNCRVFGAQICPVENQILAKKLFLVFLGRLAVVLRTTKPLNKTKAAGKAASASNQ
jgi:hypothetical protein